MVLSCMLAAQNPIAVVRNIPHLNVNGNYCKPVFEIFHN